MLFFIFYFVFESSVKTPVNPLTGPGVFVSTLLYLLYLANLELGELIVEKLNGSFGS